MASAYVAIDGYVVKKVTEKTIGVVKASNPFGELVWLPRSTCADGDMLDLGETDISVAEWLAEDRGLDF